MEELRFIDPGPVRAMRTQEEAEAQKLRAQIAQLQEQLAVREARISVLDEVLSRCKVGLEAMLPPRAAAALAEAQEQAAVPPPVPVPEARRASASSMEERRAAVEAIFRRHGDMTPRDLLPLVNAELDEELLPHQLRAILRKYARQFEGRADQHGIWGLIKR